MVETNFDVIVIGMGPGGEVAAGRLIAAGKRVAVIERELIGGECGYWACIPSKTLLRPLEVRRAAGHAAGLQRPELSWPDLREYRDGMIRHLDDAAQIASYRDQGAAVFTGTGRLSGPGAVQIDGRTLRAEHVIIATGSDPVRPHIEGLDEVPVWTNREATTLTEIPERAVVIGGSAAGIELGQFLARMGATVTIVQRAPRLLDREEAAVGEVAREILQADRIDIRLGAQAVRARGVNSHTVVELDDGSTVDSDVIVLAAGRRPRIDNIGLDTVGIASDTPTIPVDEQCRLTDGLWAVGDATGVAMFTHVAMYQGRIVADAILGKPCTAHYHGIPRVVFADPEIAAVGLTGAQAAEQRIRVTSAEIDLPEVLARPWTYDTEPQGRLGLLADSRNGVLVGAWAVAPQAAEWIHTAALAIRTRIPLSVLQDQVAQFPSYNEAYLKGVESLIERTAE